MLVKNITKHFNKFLDDVTLEVAKEAYKTLETYLDDRYELEAKTRMKTDREGAMVFKKAVVAAKEAAQKASVEKTETDKEEEMLHHSV